MVRAEIGLEPFRPADSFIGRKLRRGPLFVAASVGPRRELVSEIIIIIRLFAPGILSTRSIITAVNFSKRWPRVRDSLIESSSARQQSDSALASFPRRSL